MGDQTRLAAGIAEALADRASIDWRAARSRARSAAERALVAQLQHLDTIRRETASSGSRPANARVAGLAVRVVLVLAFLQLASCTWVLLQAYQGAVDAAWRMPQTLLAVAFGAAAALLAPHVRREPRGLALVGAFVTAASAFARSAIAGLGTGWDAPAGLFIGGVVPEAFTPACLWLFALDFPRTRRFTPFDLFARRTAIVALLLGASLFAVNVAAAHFDLRDTWAHLFVRDDGSRLFWYAFALTLVPPVLIVAHRSRRAPAAERVKVVRFALAILLGAAPFFASGLLWLASPLAHDVLAAGPLGFIWSEQLIVGVLVATPILCALATIVDRPFERARSTRPQTFANVREDLARRLRPRWRADEEQLLRALDGLRVARGSREIMDGVRRSLRRSLGIAGVHFLLPDERGSLADAADGTVVISLDDCLIVCARQAAAPLDVSRHGDLRGLLPAASRTWVEEQGAALVVALTLRDDALAAVLVLGPKRGGLPFDRQERWFVASLTRAAAVAWGTADSTTGRDDDAGFECPACGLVDDVPALACGCGVQPRLAALPHRLASHFIVERRLGAGGMGVVYLGRDTRLDRQVALKTLPRLAAGASARLDEEARAMASLSHEGLATIFGVERWRGTPVLVVEYLGGGTLADRIACGPMACGEVIALGQTLAGALGYMHARGLLHRDLKPSNIGFTADGPVKLLDFGLARLAHADAAGTGTSRLAGTPAYLPPEAFAGVGACVGFDLWALSVVLFQALTGLNPFAGDGGRDARLDRTGLSSLLTAHDASTLAPFFERALAIDPAMRFQTSDELRRGLVSGPGGP